MRSVSDRGAGVDSKQRRDEFLAKAKEAQEWSERTPDRHEKESWLRIAESYRELARRQGIDRT
jgi:hypothetical protein